MNNIYYQQNSEKFEQLKTLIEKYPKRYTKI